MTLIRRLGVLSILLVATFAAISCSDDDDKDKVGGAESQLCGDLNDLATALQQVDNLTPASTVDQAKQAQSGVEKAMSDVRNSAKNVASARVDNLDKAVSDFQKSTSGLQSDQTLASASAEIKLQAANVTTARLALRQQANCPQ